MAKTPESDELVRDVIAAHLREGEELLWVGGLEQWACPGALFLSCAAAVAAVVLVVSSSLLIALLTDVPSLWVVPAPFGVVLFGWLVHAARKRLRGRFCAVTSRRFVVANSAKGAPVESFDLAANEDMRVVMFGDGPAALWMPGASVKLLPVLEDESGALVAIDRAQRAAGAASDAGERGAERALGAEAAGPLARYLRPEERVLWAGRPDWTLVQTRALPVFGVAALVAFLAALSLTDRLWSEWQRWATVVGAVGLCLVAGGAFIGLCRRRNWCVVSSERVLAATGPRRQVAWADLRSLRHLQLRETSSGRGSVSVRTGRAVPAGPGVGRRGHALGARAKLAFAWWRDAAGFYHALSDARRQAVRRAERLRPGAERAPWASSGPRSSYLPAFLAFVGASLALPLPMGAVQVWAGGALGVGEDLLGLWAGMATSAALCGLAWWFASPPAGPTTQASRRRASPSSAFTSREGGGIMKASAGPSSGERVSAARRTPPEVSGRGTEVGAVIGHGVEAGWEPCSQEEAMAKPLESDEFVRDVVAAHLPKGEELLWAERLGRFHLRVLCPLAAGVVTWAVAMAAAGALGVPLEVAALVVGSCCAVFVLGAAGVLAVQGLRRRTYLGLTGLRVVRVTGAVKPGVMRSFDLASMAARRTRRSLVGRLLRGRAFTWAVMEGVRDPEQVAEMVAGAHRAAARAGRAAEPADACTPACDARAEAVLAPRLREGESLLWAARDRRSYVWRRPAWALGGLLVAAAAVASGHVALESTLSLPVLVLYAGLAVLAAGASAFALARAVGRRRRAYGVTTERILSALASSGRRLVSVPLAGVRDLVVVEDTDGAGSISFGVAGRGLGLGRHHLTGLAEGGSAYESICCARQGGPARREAPEPTL